MPNGLVAGQRLINYGAGERDYRTSLRVPLDATLPVGRAKRILLSGALDAGRKIPGLAPDVLLAEYGDGAAIYVVRFRVPDFGQEAACRDTVASRVLHALHCAGQTIQQTGPNGPIPVPWRSAAEALLGQVDLFRGFDAAERAQLATKLRMREADAGQMIVRQGDSGDFLYVIGEGILGRRSGPRRIGTDPGPSGARGGVWGGLAADRSATHRERDRRTQFCRLRNPSRGS